MTNYEEKVIEMSTKEYTTKPIKLTIFDGSYESYKYICNAVKRAFSAYVGLSFDQRSLEQYGYIKFYDRVKEHSIIVPRGNVIGLTHNNHIITICKEDFEENYIQIVRLIT